MFRAFDEKLHRVVAIKALAPVLATSPWARQQFVREARSAAAVTHENVIAIYGVEEAGPAPYLVMQFEGISLEEKVRRGGPLPLNVVLRIGQDIAEGLAAAHRQGLVHRDVKPANILLENGVERVRITDFGLARGGDDASLTHWGLLTGTPTYMSPERRRGRRWIFGRICSASGACCTRCARRSRRFAPRRHWRSSSGRARSRRGRYGR